MATFIESRGDCPTCEKQTLIRRRGVNHVLHLLLSVLTVGLWLPVWLVLSLTKGESSIKGWNCTICGGPVERCQPGLAEYGGLVASTFIWIVVAALSVMLLVTVLTVVPGL